MKKVYKVINKITGELVDVCLNENEINALIKISVIYNNNWNILNRRWTKNDFKIKEITKITEIKNLLKLYK